MKYRISHKPGVPEQIHALHGYAKDAGIEVGYVDALKQIIRHLQMHPLEWGDPEYQLRHVGAVVCHGLLDPLMVRFAVFEAEEFVHVLEFKLLPGSRLDDA